MTEFTLKPKEKNTIRFNIGEESVQIPLRGSLSLKEAMGLSDEAGTYSFFKKYIPEKIFDSLTVDELNQIIEIYKKESDRYSRLSMGESQASQKR